MKKNNTDFRTLAWIVGTIKGKKRFIFLLTLVQTLSSILSMGFALFLSGLVDAAAAGDRAGLARYCCLLVGLVLVTFGLRCLSRYLDEYCRATIENTLKHKVFGSLLYKDYAQVTSQHSGEWLTRMTSDTVVVAGGVAHIVPGFCSTVVRLVASVVLLYHFLPELTWIVLIGGGLIAVATFFLRRLLKKLHKKVQKTDGLLRVFLTERLNSMMVIRAFEKEQTALEQAGERMQEHMNARMKKNHILNILHSGFTLVVNFVYITGAICCGVGILKGTMSYGSFTAVLQLVSQAQAPIANVSGYFTQYSTMIASGERLIELEHYADPETGEGRVENVTDFYNTRFRGLGLRNAGFTYLPTSEQGESRNQVLKGLNMEIARGEYVAFCGPSGCGKSTVLKLLMCMYELDEGERFVSHEDGQTPLTRDWRGLFSYVPQGNQLMSGTIREVVTFGEAADMGRDEAIWQALRISRAEDFVRELPEGLDTQLGERGAGLSEGQMQRIAIARAVFSDRPILLLDEATSALDEQTEADVLDNLRAMTSKTVIIVTHRPAALAITDKIIHFTPPEA